jgi:hypothetical protein
MFCSISLGQNYGRMFCYFRGSELRKDVLCISLGEIYGTMFCVFPWVRTREGCFVYFRGSELQKDILCISLGQN